MMLQHVDFPATSLDNLYRLRRFTVSGTNSADLRREVDEAWLHQTFNRRDVGSRKQGMKSCGSKSPSNTLNIHHHP